LIPSRPFRAALSIVVLGGAFSDAQSPRPLRVACIGNSITAGFGVPVADRPTKSYPAVLGQKLGVGYVVKSFGVSGATLLRRGNYPYRNQNEFTASAAWLPDIVVIQLGTNDAKAINIPFYGDALADYVALINHYAKLPSRPRIFVNLPPTLYVDSTVKPTYPVDARLVKHLIPKILLAAKQTNATVIDVHAATAGKAALFPDGVHPNEAGARLIAEAVHKAIMTAAVPVSKGIGGAPRRPIP
jgi:lysophospholipase L1-like esterase